VKDRVMVMGDMVLFEDEVNPVMSVALDKGLEGSKPIKVETRAKTNKHPYALDYS
jgi:hypothetical protein